MIRAITFDLMGTVAISTESAEIGWLSFLHLQLARFGLNKPENELLAAWHQAETRPSEHGFTPFEERICRVALELELQLDWPDVSSVADAICQRSAGFLCADPEIFPLLAFLRKSGLETPLVTNYDHPPAVYRLLKSHGLEGAFQPVIISGEVGVWKPNPQILDQALRMVGVKSNQAMYVGDSREDIKAAMDAGMHPVLVTRDDGYADPLRSRGNPEVEYAEEIHRHRVRVIRRLGEVRGLLSQF